MEPNIRFDNNNFDTVGSNSNTNATNSLNKNSAYDGAGGSNCFKHSQSNNNSLNTYTEPFGNLNIYLYRENQLSPPPNHPPPPPPPPCSVTPNVHMNTPTNFQQTYLHAQDETIANTSALQHIQRQTAAGSSCYNCNQTAGATTLEEIILPEFLPLCDLLFNILSIAAYFCDVVFDCITIYILYINRDYLWFLLTFLLVLSSSFISQILSFFWYYKYRKRTEKIFIWTDLTNSLVIITHLLQLGVLWRYFKLFIPVDLSSVKHEVRDLCILRMVHAFCEAAPMLLIQVYLIWCKSSADQVTDLNVISTFLSLFSLCWALASFSKNVRKKNMHKLVLTWLGVIFQFLWRLGTISSRIVALTVYANIYRNWVFLVMCLHWTVMFVCLVIPKSIFQGEKVSLLKRICYSALLAWVYIFCYINLQENHIIHRMVAFYATMFLENTLLLLLSLNISRVLWFNHLSIFLVWAGLSLGVLFMILYYKFFHIHHLKDIYLNGNYDLIEFNNNNNSNNHQHHLQNTGSSSNTTTINNNNNQLVVTANSQMRQFGYTNANGDIIKSAIGNLNSSTNCMVPGVFNCRINPALKRKKKKPSTFIPPPTHSTALPNVPNQSQKQQLSNRSLSPLNNMQHQPSSVATTLHNTSTTCKSPSYNYLANHLNQSQKQQQQQQLSNRSLSPLNNIQNQPSYATTTLHTTNTTCKSPSYNYLANHLNKHQEQQSMNQRAFVSPGSRMTTRTPIENGHLNRISSPLTSYSSNLNIPNRVTSPIDRIIVPANRANQNSPMNAALHLDSSNRLISPSRRVVTPLTFNHNRITSPVDNRIVSPLGRADRLISPININTQRVLSPINRNNRVVSPAAVVPSMRNKMTGINRANLTSPVTSPTSRITSPLNIGSRVMTPSNLLNSRATPINIGSSDQDACSVTSSRVNIQQKLQEKKQQQLLQLREIEEEIKQGKLKPHPLSSDIISPSFLPEVYPPSSKEQPWLATNLSTNKISNTTIKLSNTVAMATGGEATAGDTQASSMNGESSESTGLPYYYCHPAFRRLKLRSETPEVLLVPHYIDKSRVYYDYSSCVVPQLVPFHSIPFIHSKRKRTKRRTRRELNEAREQK